MQTITLIDELTYRCYVANRKRSPQIQPYQWACIFPSWETFEERYQEEQELGLTTTIVVNLN